MFVMRCFGRTRDGQRCRNATGFLVCEKHMLQAGLVGAILTAITTGAAYVWKEVGLSQRLADVLRQDEWFEGQWEVDVQRTFAGIPKKLLDTLDTPARTELERTVQTLKVQISRDGGTMTASRRVDSELSANASGGTDQRRLAVGGAIRFTLRRASERVAMGTVTEMPPPASECSTPVDRTFKMERYEGAVSIEAPWTMCRSTWRPSSIKSSEEAGHVRIYLRRPR
jgi:hypothetical protein